MSGSTRQSRDHRKWLTARRAQFRLKQAFDRIDWVEDVLNPESEALLRGTVGLEIEAGSTEAADSIIHMTVKNVETSPADAE